MNEEIVSLQKDDQMIPYKKYIRKIVDANTVHLRDSFDTRFRAVGIFRRAPVKPTKKWSLMPFFVTFCS